MDMVLQYAKRFLPEWTANCEKLQFEAAMLLIEGLSTCGWDRKSYYDTEFMKRLGEYIDLDVLRNYDKLRPVNWHVNRSTSQEIMDPPTKKRRIDYTPPLPPSTSCSTEYTLESFSPENVEGSTSRTNSEPTSKTRKGYFNSQLPDGIENLSSNNVSAVSPTHRESCVSRISDDINTCNTQFPESGCLPSEVQGHQDIGIIDYNYDALRDGEDISRLIDSQCLQKIDVHYFDPL